MKKLFIISNDKIGRKAIHLLEQNKSNDLHVVIDKSSSLKRVFKLIIKGIMPLNLVVKMFFAELFRKDYSIINYSEIKTNKDLLRLIDEINPAKIILFRAGLIINKKVIEKKIPLLNIHCANVPEFGGLGSIQKAITHKAYNQNACLHHVTVKIDEGEVLAKEPYTLSPKRSYFANENIAYEAGIKLILRELIRI